MSTRSDRWELPWDRCCCCVVVILYHTAIIIIIVINIVYNIIIVIAIAWLRFVCFYFCIHCSFSYFVVIVVVVVVSAVVVVVSQSQRATLIETNFRFVLFLGAKCRCHISICLIFTLCLYSHI